MEYLQYFDNVIKCQNNIDVLNLIINGIPSIQGDQDGNA